MIQVAILWILLCSATGWTQEWTRFRGPNGSGVSPTQLPTNWNEKEINWNAKLPGTGHSSPVVWNDRIYLMSADPQDATQYVSAIDVKTGESVWTREFPIHPYKIHARSSFASCTPTVDANHVYVAWSTPEQTVMMAIDHTGKTKWQRDFGTYASSHGFGASPILFDDLVILSVMQKKPEKKGPAIQNSHVFACHRLTGELIWDKLLWSESVSYSVPCILAAPDRDTELILCSTAHGIFSLDPRSGNENWSIDVFDKRTISSPVLADGLIFGTTGSGSGGNYIVAIRPGPDPSLVYERRKQAPYVPTPVAKDGMIFLWSDKGVVSCIRTSDGELVWERRVGGNYSGSPIIAGDKVYCIDEDGTVVVIAAANKFQLLGKTPLGEPSRSTPAVAGGRLYLRTYTQLFSVGGA